MANAHFPGAVWDGSSSTRSATLDNEPLNEIERPPDSADWQQIVAETVAIETAVTTNTAGLATATLIAGAGNTTTLANAATAGFFFIPKVNGAPTGTPAAVPSGYLAMCYDYTNHKLYVYDGGWIKTAALS